LKTRTTICLTLAIFIAPTALSAGEITENLPESTVLYARLDMGLALRGYKDQIKAIDEEQAEKLLFQSKSLIKQFKAMAARHEFRPKLFDELEKTKMHFILSLLKEPIVKVHKYKVPKRDPETGAPLPGEFREMSFTQRQEFAFALVLDTTEEVATDFLDQVKALTRRQKEKAPTSDAPAYRELEVDKGELISSPDGAISIGRLGNRLLLAQGNPKELWATLLSTPEKTIAESATYKRLNADKLPPQALVVANISTLTGHLEKTLKRQIEEARKGAGDNPQMAKWRIASAEANHKQFIFAKKLLGLDRIKCVGLSAHVGKQDGAIVNRYLMTAQLEAPIAPMVRMLLDGGRKLEAPRIGQVNGIGLMFRAGFSGIFKELLKEAQAEQQLVNELGMISAQVKGMTGFSLTDILGQLSGDVYTFLDLVKKKHTVKRYQETPEGEGRIVNVEVEEPLPEILVLLGLKDRAAFNEMISKAFTSISAQPNGAQILRKRVYQGTPVYVVGRDAGKEDADPDGLTTFACVVVGRHLSFGTWKDVTRLIRLSKAGNEEAGKLAPIVARNRDAGLIMTVESAMAKRIEKMQRDKLGIGNPIDHTKLMLKLIDGMPMDFVGKDEAEQRKFRESLKRMVEANQVLTQKVHEMLPKVIVAAGKLNGNFYDLRCEVLLKKKP
jgi:hypothetical protein